MKKDFITTKSANYLAKAFCLPIEVSYEIFEMSKDMEERNYMIMMTCFNFYLDEFLGITDYESEDYMKLIDEHYSGFLETAVDLSLPETAGERNA